MDPIKVVPASRTSVTKGFEISKPKTDVDGSKLNHSETDRSKQRTPEPEAVTSKIKAKEFKPDAAIDEFAKVRGQSKELLSLIVVGHVDAGKSTLMGHFLHQMGQVPKKTMHKYDQESKKIGKQSFMYAWILDETGEERSRGITMDVAQSKFETPTKNITLLDAPGHKDFIPNMITGASQADVAILVVDATKGEFETGFESGGQTREHALLVRSLGVSQIVVAINKLDTVSWSKDRFNEIKIKMMTFLVKTSGFKEADVTFVPCSGLNGENLTKPSSIQELSCWYKGPTVLEAIDSFKPVRRPIGKPLRLSLTDVFKGQGGLSIAGRMESGMVQTNDKVLVQPIGEIVTVKNVSADDETGKAFAGDSILLSLHGYSDANIFFTGTVISDPNFPCPVASKFEARIVTFDAMTIPFTKGFTGVIHIGAMSEQVVVKKLISQLHKTTGEVIKSKPRCLPKNSNGLIELETSRPICIEEFKDFKELGRFTLRYAGVTIAAGVVTKIP